MSVKERLIEYLKFKKIGYSLFGRTIDVSSAFVTSMRNSIQPDKVERIALNYPDLNIGWLLTGEGKMLRTDALGLYPENLSGYVEEDEAIVNYVSESPARFETDRNTIEAKYIAKIEKLEAKLDQKDEQIGILIKSVEKLTDSIENLADRVEYLTGNLNRKSNNVKERTPNVKESVKDV